VLKYHATATIEQSVSVAGPTLSCTQEQDPFISWTCAKSVPRRQREQAHTSSCTFRLLHSTKGAGMRSSNSSTMKVISIRRGQIEWLAKGRAVEMASPARERRALSRSWVRISSEANFRLLGEKKPLAVLAARLGPLGHGPGFGGFLYPVSRLGFLLMKKRWGPFHTPRVEFFKLNGLKVGSSRWSRGTGKDSGKVESRYWFQQNDMY